MLRGLSTKLTAAVAMVVLNASVSLAVPTFRTVAMVGDPVPGVPNAAFFRVSAPQINNAGEVQFEAVIVGPGISDGGLGGIQNNFGVWSEKNGLLDIVARLGDRAPGTPEGVVFRHLTRVSLADTGDRLITGILTGPGIDSSNDDGLWAGPTGNNLQLVARQGQPAPGTPDGVVFAKLRSSLGTFAGSTSGPGHVIFNAGLSGPGIDRSNEGGIWSDVSGTLSLIARKGTQAPSLPIGVTFVDLGLPAPHPTLNDNGHLAFVAELAGPGIGESNNRGIWSDRGGSLEPIVREGEPAPGLANGATLTTMASPEFNNHGQISFVGRAKEAGAAASSIEGVWVEQNQTLRLVAQTAERAPETPEGTVFDAGTFGAIFGAHRLSDAGQVVFQANLGGPNIDASNWRGLFMTDANGDLRLLAQNGEHAPGLPDGAVLDDPSGLSTFGVLETGQIAFLAPFSGPGIDELNRGLWVTDAAGDPQLILKDGDLVDIDPDPLVQDLRTIAAFGLPFSSGSNDSGQISVAMTFTDGAGGILVTNNLIPEPTTLALCCATGLCFMVRLRHRDTPLSR